MSQELVGRPLVPFFDAEENVNERLEVDLSTRADDGLDVDARVWDKERGYFVYPTDAPVQTQPPGPSQTPRRPSQTSTPIPIAAPRHAPRANANANAHANCEARRSERDDSQTSSSSTSPVLLTPDMLVVSRSAPDARTYPSQSHPQIAHVASVQPKDTAAARSSSAKRATRSRNTPRRSRAQQTDGQTQSSPDAAQPETRSAPGSAKKHRAKQSNGRTKDGKEKWAWSAFQSSPDPTLLPLPPAPFVGAEGEAAGSAPILSTPAPAVSIPKIQERLDPPPPIPPLPPDHSDMSREVSMTQDLRRMLNIGG